MGKPLEGTLEQVLAAKEARVVHRIEGRHTALQAAQQMTDLGVGSLLIVGPRGRPDGIFTERDLVRRVVAAGLAAGDTLVQTVMTRPVVTMRRRTTVGQALALCTNRHFRRLPIVAGGQLIGLVTLGDLTRWVVEHQRQEITELNDYIWGPEGSPG